MADDKHDLADRLFAGVAWAPIESTAAQGDLPYVTHQGTLTIAGATIRCYQLSDGARVLDATDCAALFGWDAPVVFRVGDRVRVVAPIGSIFYSYVGVVVAGPKRRKGRATEEWGVQFPGHPWQEKQPSAVWFFNAAELERVP